MSERRPFALDRFQVEAIEELRRGHSVLVAAPTGSGKTVVAEAAIDMALAAGGTAFYTTPIKALSNQKHRDLSRRLGPTRVGLLTGDTSFQGDAPVVVMTTEVLRNMIYARSGALDDLRVVVLDEVHYLQDAYRGSVWEEVIIHLPRAVRLVCLSATVSNAAEVGEWIGAVRGPTGTVVETERPVDLQPLYQVGDRNAERAQLIPVLVDGRPNPVGYRLSDDPRSRARTARGRPRRRYFTPRRVETIERLADEDLLPTIHFIFSRAACDDAVRACRDAGLRLTDRDERARIRHLAEERLTSLDDADLDALDYDVWLESLEAGIAAHHAGLIPAFKEVVETTFTAGLVKAVFATETLALGINMPARSVVIEKLTKYNGDSHQFLTPAEFTQLTGRAGRRGIDEVGYAVVDWSPFVSFDQVASLVSSRSFPLSSSFRPTYNMAANLMSRYSKEEAHEILGQSFAQFQADRAMVGLQRRLHEDRQRLAALDDALRCEHGDVAEFVELRERLRRAERRGSGAAAALRSATMLRPGDLIALPEAAGADAGHPAIVISVAHRGKGAVRVRSVDAQGEIVAFSAADLDTPIHPSGNVELPTPFAPHDPGFLDQCAARVIVAPTPAQPPGAADSERADRAEGVARLRAAVAAHPVAGCPQVDAHLAALDERGSVQRDTERLGVAVRRRQSLLATRLDSVVDLLEHLGLCRDWSLNADGQRLARIYHECDLLIIVALRDGVFDDLAPGELASLLSALTYEERGSQPGEATPVSDPRVARRSRDLEVLARRVGVAEAERGLTRSRLPNAGLAAAVSSWASGAEFADVVGSELSAGDFVRNINVIVDLADQIAKVAPRPATATAAAAVARLLIRGVVAAAGQIGRP